MRLAVREAALQGAALYWDGFDALLADDKEASRSMLLQELETRTGMTFSSPRRCDMGAGRRATRSTVRVRIEIPLPTYAERLQLWETSLNGHTPRGTDADLGTLLASEGALSGGQIRDAAATARNLALWRNP